MWQHLVLGTSQQDTPQPLIAVEEEAGSFCLASKSLIKVLEYTARAICTEALMIMTCCLCRRCLDAASHATALLKNAAASCRLTYCALSDVLHNLLGSMLHNAINDAQCKPAYQARRAPQTILFASCYHNSLPISLFCIGRQSGTVGGAYWVSVVKSLA